jgi:hypothetical protein
VEKIEIQHTIQKPQFHFDPLFSFFNYLLFILFSFCGLSLGLLYHVWKAFSQILEINGHQRSTEAFNHLLQKLIVDTVWFISQ